MKFIVSSDLLYRNLSAISGVMGTNSTMPILDNFLVTIEGDQLKLTASDLESTMTSVIELDNVEGEGSVAVPAKILLETLKLMPDMPLVFAIDTENNILKFTSSNGEYGAPCFPSDEYPTVKPIESPKSFDIRASVLQRAISKTIFATGNDELRTNMMSVIVTQKFKQRSSPRLFCPRNPSRTLKTSLQMSEIQFMWIILTRRTTSGSLSEILNSIPL